MVTKMNSYHVYTYKREGVGKRKKPIEIDVFEYTEYKAISMVVILAKNSDDLLEKLKSVIKKALKEGQVIRVIGKEYSMFYIRANNELHETVPMLEGAVERNGARKYILTYYFNCVKGKTPIVTILNDIQLLRIQKVLHCLRHTMIFLELDLVG